MVLQCELQGFYIVGLGTRRSYRSSDDFFYLLARSFSPAILQISGPTSENVYAKSFKVVKPVLIFFSWGWQASLERDMDDFVYYFYFKWEN